ncbi:hypothetical protein F2Q68_00003668 [Brassica cretica]|uniref:Uncharacterized protein n=1 Tax=Brassica cretica TaxID=69181 RepID=A0A8S9JN76_BRACR|nr:hypothetical protein F2Q68_00003668 [Brassica cretica]
MKMGRFEGFYLSGVLNSFLLFCNGGTTSRYVRRLEATADMPLDSDVFHVERSTAYQPWIWTVGSHELDFAPPDFSRTSPSRVLLLTPSRTCLDAAASLPPLWASNDSVLHLLLCEGLCIFSFDSLYYATPDLFFFSICRRQWWLSLLDLLCSERIPAQHCMLFSIDIGITLASSLLRGYTKLEPLTIAEMSSSSLPSHRISPSYAPVGALGSRWTKAGVTSLSPCVQRSFSGLYHPSLVSCVACNNTNVVGVLRTCLDAAASLPPLWASNDSVLHLLLCERLCISSFDSLYYATPDLFFFSICRRQWWLSLLDLLCSEQARKSSVILRLLTSINSKIRIPAQHCMLFSVDIGITPASSLLRGYTKLEPLTIAEMRYRLHMHRYGHWDQDGQRLVLRLFLHVYKEALADCIILHLCLVWPATTLMLLMSIADETAEGLFVGIDGAGEGVNSEEEEARWRAEREAAEREVARVRMRQELERELTQKEEARWRAEREAAEREVARVRMRQEWTKAGVTSLSPCVQRSFSGLYHPSLVSCVACNNTNVVGVLSIDDETAEGLFVGIDGAGEGVNSEEEEARWRAEREAAEREVARVRMRQE